MKNNYLIEKKENIFTKISNFIKNLFNNEKTNIIYSPNQTKKIEEQENIESDGLAYIKIKKEEDPTLLRLQSELENKEIFMSDLSDNQIAKLNELYARQIENLKKEIENKKIQIGMLRFRLTGSVNKI